MFFSKSMDELGTLARTVLICLLSLTKNDGLVLPRGRFGNGIATDDFSARKM
jgi:hypothetical protein